jgi:hypothetical protein
MDTVRYGEPFGGELIVFIHLFKTGGTSLYDAMNRTVQRDYVLANPPDIRARVKQNTKMLAGHISFSQEHISILESLNTKMYTITLLRHPVERVISDYYWIKHHDFDYKVHYRNEPIETWLAEGFTRGINQATAWFCGKPQAEATVEEAQQNILNNITDFGLLEDFDYFVQKISRDTGYPIFDNLSEIPAKQNPHRPMGVDPATKTVIEEYNQKDIELYAWAKDLYEQRKEKI